jgi:Ca-activated chloride channel family protein
MKEKGYSRGVVLLCIILMAWLAACGATEEPEASKARSRAVINAGEIVPAEELRVAEYLQYYEQHFPEPVHDAVGLDLRLGNSRLPAQGGMAWLQIGCQTKSAETEGVAPLNLAIVIDRSGSMNERDKMPYLKQSLAVFLESLNANDIVSIVAYSDQAEVLLPAQFVGDGRWIEAVVARIGTGGATNLHAGMMKGFQEVDKNYSVRRNNRVILLTDGIANRGETDPEEIAADALVYNEKGIFLSTIGLGLEYNDELLSQLSRQGKGGYSFVDSAQEMDRIFRQQVTGMTQRVASDVNITVIPDAGVRLIGLTGLDGTPPSQGASIPLWQMGTGGSTVILAQLQVGPSTGSMVARPLARVELRYFDEFAQRTVTREGTVTAEMVVGLPSYDPTWDLEILRNVTIQRTAEGMREIDQLFDARQYEAAWRLAVHLEQQLTEVARLTGDEQMLDDAVLMQRYQQTLADAVWQTMDRAPQFEPAPATDDSERPYRGSPPTPAPYLPEVELK